MPSVIMMESTFRMKAFVGLTAVAIVVATALFLLPSEDTVDDWRYESVGLGEKIVRALRQTGGAMKTGNVAMEAADSLGFAVGGAKDINNFRENIRNGYLPLPTDITYEGLFYDYYFETEDRDCEIGRAHV